MRANTFAYVWRQQGTVRNPINVQELIMMTRAASGRIKFSTGDYNARTPEMETRSDARRLEPIGHKPFKTQINNSRLILNYNILLITLPFQQFQQPATSNIVLYLNKVIFFLNYMMFHGFLKRLCSHISQKWRCTKMAKDYYIFYITKPN